MRAHLVEPGQVVHGALVLLGGGHRAGKQLLLVGVVAFKGTGRKK